MHNTVILVFISQDQWFLTWNQSIYLNSPVFSWKLAAQIKVYCHPPAEAGFISDYFCESPFWRLWFNHWNHNKRSITLPHWWCSLSDVISLQSSSTVLQPAFSTALCKFRDWHCTKIMAQKIPWKLGSSIQKQMLPPSLSLCILKFA